MKEKGKEFQPSGGIRGEKRKNQKRVRRRKE